MALQITCSKRKLLMMLALVVMASFFLNNISAEAASRSPGPSTLEYYVHAMLDSSTAYIVKPVNATATGTFGQLAVFSYKVTLQEDFNSTQVGSIRGLQVSDGLNPSEPSVLVLDTLSYDDGVYSGSISLHGQASMNSTSIVVVGGTGDFRGVRGYAAITNLRTPGSDRVFKHVLHFL